MQQWQIILSNHRRDEVLGLMPPGLAGDALQPGWSGEPQQHPRARLEGGGFIFLFSSCL